eukprot:5709426-Pleurochrysis_carterae.AAC.1
MHRRAAQHGAGGALFSRCAPCAYEPDAQIKNKFDLISCRVHELKLEAFIKEIMDTEAGS